MCITIDYCSVYDNDGACTFHADDGLQIQA